MRGIFSVSLVLRMAVLFVMFFMVWTTITYFTESAKDVAQSLRMQEVAEYVESKVFSTLLAIQEGPEMSESIRLPQLAKLYTVSLACTNGMLTIVATTGVTAANYMLTEYVNCTNMQLSGEVFYGERCIWGNKTNDTNIVLQLKNRCGDA